MRYIVVGSGPAGISAAEEIRKTDPEGKITMITADPHPAYSPVMLTYWMSGHYTHERLFFRDMGSWVADHRVDLRCDQQVTAVDVQRRVVTLSPGEEFAYDRLLIATGAVPLIPPIHGIRAKGVCTFRTFADAEEILTSRRDLEHLCIMGGGFIGIKLACHLRGLSVLVVEKEPRLASRIFDQRASELVKEQLRRNGISVETGTGITDISNRDGWVSGVRLEDGRMFPAQILVVAVGVRPNTSFMEAPMTTTGGGIPVDERMETPAPHVYAAGDVATTRDSITLLPFSNAVWPAATRQGKVAGANMAGGRRTYVHNFNMNALNLCGLPIASAGHSLEPAGDDIAVFQEAKNNETSEDCIPEARIGDFSGPPAPAAQRPPRRLFERKARVSSLQRSEEKQGRKMSSAWRDHDFQRSVNGYRKIVLKSGVLIGFILIGDTTRAGLFLSRMKRGDIIENPAELLTQTSHAPSGLSPNMGFRHGALWPQSKSGVRP
jgi:NAD(P)H-nitrite reductase large subunit